MPASSARPYRDAANTIREDARDILSRLRAERLASRPCARSDAEATEKARAPAKSRPSADGFAASPDTVSLLGEETVSGEAAPRTRRKARGTSGAASAAAKKRVDAAKNELDALAEKRRADEAEIKALARETARHKRLTKKHESDAKRAGAALDKLQAEIGTLTAKRDDRTEEIAALIDAEAEAVATLEGLNADIEAARSELEDVRADVLAAQADLAAAASKVELAETMDAPLDGAPDPDDFVAAAFAKLKGTAPSGASAASPPKKKAAKPKRQKKEADVSVDTEALPSAAVASELSALPHISDGMVWHLEQAGIATMDDLAAADPRKLRRRLGPVGQLAQIDEWVAIAREG